MIEKLVPIIQKKRSKTTAGDIGTNYFLLLTFQLIEFVV